MLPIVIHPNAVRVGVAGIGDGLGRRLQTLSDAGFEPAAVFRGNPPEAKDLESLNLLFVAGLDERASQAIADQARKAGVLINVEDQPALCDFHVPASVRRGDLLFTVSTGGRSPAVARLLREDLDRRYGPEWEGRLSELGQRRAEWRSEGASAAEISGRTRSLVSAKGWL